MHSSAAHLKFGSADANQCCYCRCPCRSTGRDGFTAGLLCRQWIHRAFLRGKCTADCMLDAVPHAVLCSAACFRAHIFPCSPKSLQIQRRVTSCDAYLSMLWLVWAIQVAFITTTGWAYSAKQIHNFRVRALVMRCDNASL